MRSKRVTLAEIAAACGVSKTVVSLALNRKTHPAVRYSQDTAERIRATAKQLGYRPTRASRAHFGGRHRAYGLLISNLHQLSTVTLQIIHNRTAEHGCMLTIESWQRSDRNLPVLVAENVVDGLLLFEELTTEIQQAIENAGLPCVQINTDRQRGNGVIAYDEGGGMRQIAAACRARGAQRLALFRNMVDGHRFYHRQRAEGLQQACHELGLPEPLIHDYIRTPAESPQGLARLQEEWHVCLECHPEIDVIVCHSLAASRAYRVAQALGRRIPADLQVIGIGADAVGKHLMPTLSHIAIDQVDLGRQAVERLEALIQGRRQPRLLMPYGFEPGGSTQAM